MQRGALLEKHEKVKARICATIAHRVCKQTSIWLCEDQVLWCCKNTANPVMLFAAGEPVDGPQPSVKHGSAWMSAPQIAQKLANNAELVKIFLFCNKMLSLQKVNQ